MTPKQIAKLLFYARLLYSHKLPAIARAHVAEIEAVLYHALTSQGHDPGADENTARLLYADLEQAEKQLPLPL